jgi:hypothetical protein
MLGNSQRSTFDGTVTGKSWRGTPQQPLRSLKPPACLGRHQREEAMEQPFQNSEESVTKLYESLMKRVRTLGEVIVEPKKTSIHVKHRAAFLGVHPKKKWLDLNIVTDAPIKSGKVLKTEQVSKSRYHNMVRICSEKDINPELLGWLKQAYILMAS